MAYSTIEDLKKIMRESEIIELTDDRNTGNVDTLVVDDAIAQADALIDSFMRGRYPAEIPEGEVPAMISDISTKLAAYNLYGRGTMLTLPESIKDGYKWCTKILLKIQDGTISPFPAVNEPLIIKTNKTAESKIYNDAVWSTYC